MRYTLVLAALACAAAAFAYVEGGTGGSRAAGLQGDVTCDDDIGSPDVVAIVRERAGLGDGAPCSYAGDLNCDDVVDERDALLLLVALAAIVRPPGEGACPLAGAVLPNDESDTAASLEFYVTPRLQCGGEVPFHVITVQWDIAGVPPPVGISVKALYSWGTSDEFQSTSLSGQTQFEEPDAGGGAVIVSITAVAETEALGDEEHLLLESCFAPPATPQPGAGFLAFPTPGPPDLPLSGPTTDILRETDVAHVGGSPAGPTPDISVVAAGTGAAWRLLSYGTGGSPPVPAQLGETAAFGGHDIKLIALKPDIAPNLALNLLVAAYLRDGNLWLSSWRIGADGSFTALDKRGFGANLGLIVERYGIAQQPLQMDNSSPSAYRVVTPVIGTQVTPQGGAADGGVLVVTWSVNANTGAISGLYASAPWGDPAPDAALSVTPLDGDNVQPGAFVLAYRTGNDIMETQFWHVTNSGEPFIRGKSTSGYDRAGSANVAEPMRETALVPLTHGGFISPTYDGGVFNMVTWETRLDFCFFGTCFYAPYRISDESNDLQVGPGVALPLANQPTLTDGSSPNVAGGATQTVRARLTDVLWEESFGTGAGTIYQETPGGFTAVGIASVGKTMTLWLALELINDGEFSLSDEVTVSQTAVNAGGSLMGLSVGEKHTLENLIYGMMLPSGNDAAFAIGEYMAGSVQDWVDLMNERAADLGLANTIYSRPSGGAYSTTQEQTTLWIEASKEAGFLFYAAATSYQACGELQNGVPVCYNLSRNPPGYPGWGGYKGGSVGFSIPSFAQAGVPLCTRCLLGEAERLGRRLVFMLQQSGATGADAVEMLDFGYLTLFTPDRVAEFDTGTANDFGLDAVNDGLAIEAHINGDQKLTVCTYSMFADGGQLDQNGCDSPRIADMLLSASGPAPTRVDAVRVSTLLREGDYLTGYWLAGHIELDLWQVAPKEP